MHGVETLRGDPTVVFRCAGRALRGGVVAHYCIKGIPSFASSRLIRSLLPSADRSVLRQPFEKRDEAVLLFARWFVVR